VNVKDIQPVKKVGAKVPLGPRVPGVAIGRRQNAHVDFLLRARPQPTQLVLFQHAQQLRLRSWGISPTSSSSSVPPEASSKQPARLSIAPVNAPFSCRRSRFRSGCREWRTIHSTNGRVLRGLRSCSVRATVLAGAAFAGDQNGNVGGRNLFDQTKISRIFRELPTQRTQYARFAQPPRTTSSSIAVSRCRVAFARMVLSRVASTGLGRKS